MFLLFRPYLRLVLGKVRDNLNIDAQSRPEIFLRAVFLWYNDDARLEKLKGGRYDAKRHTFRAEALTAERHEQVARKGGLRMTAALRQCEA